MKHPLLFPLCVAAGLVAAQSAAQAQTAVQSFNVTATVQKSCIVVTNDLSFGVYVPTDPAKEASTTLTVTCTNQTPYNVQLNDGLNGTVANRKMKGGSGSDTLNYNLYRESARTNVWGKTNASDTVAGTGNGSGQVITVYGKIPAAQYVEPQLYSDTITATISF